MKTLHGSFPFSVQRFGTGDTATNWLEQSEQTLPDYVSRRLGEFSGYYANRLSYEGVADLVERVTGERLLSDQKIQQEVIAQAVRVSEEWRESCAAAASEPAVPVAVKTLEAVDWYDAEAEEVLVLADGIQVKQQKATRQRAGQERSACEKRETVRVNTDVLMIERRAGGFEYLLAGIDERGQESVRVERRAQQFLQQEYGDRTTPLPVVALSDGAKAVRCQLETIFGKPVPVILDWYHLEKKVWELMSMAARNKVEKETHVAHLLKLLWRGQTVKTLHYLQNEVPTKNAERLAALCTYVEKHQAEIIDYERRQRAGKPIGSGRIEKGVDQTIGTRQKSKGMSWSPTGSRALGILKAEELNGRWQQLWFPPMAAH